MSDFDRLVQTVWGLKEELRKVRSDVNALQLQLQDLKSIADQTNRAKAETCKRKVRHASQRDATAAINRIKKDGRRMAYRLRSYQCEVCKGYHLTKQEL